MMIVLLSVNQRKGEEDSDSDSFIFSHLNFKIIQRNIDRHVNATKSYLYFCCFAGEAILCFKPYFQIVGSSKEKKN